ncbi:hypothetical protein BBP00_00009743 [Phytophthora kernoviae]|uniref:DDE-1 domain-containing protein n=1 Tax=Phytophthora kernoviae TaxID=325452 RepID=A0A3F2RBX3_9STRA|nr:hypothetical protein BBP00_00009743 [Phytophthora kernoviae]
MIMLFAAELVTFMKDMRREEKVLCTVHLVNFVKVQHHDWFETVIFKESPTGIITKIKVPLYPKGHVYAVQENAWMDTTVWRRYLRELLAYEIGDPSVQR